MDIQVYDTWVKRKDDQTMHFDVFINKDGGTVEKALAGAKEYLISIGEKEAVITSKECSYCHVQDAKPSEISAIKEKGYFIYKMSNCP